MVELQQVVPPFSIAQTYFPGPQSVHVLEGPVTQGLGRILNSMKSSEVVGLL